MLPNPQLPVPDVAISQQQAKCGPKLLRHKLHHQQQLHLKFIEDLGRDGLASISNGYPLATPVIPTSLAYPCYGKIRLHVNVLIIYTGAMYIKYHQ